jgi:outer membrane protein assembly factor BamB
MKKIHLFFLLLLTFFVSCAHAQWQIKSSKSINWFQISPTGNLIAGTPEGICGMDENNGSFTFTVNSIPSVTEDEFQLIPNTPFGMISRGQGKLETKVIFNLSTGKVLFDSKKENIVVGKQYILGSTGDFLMQGLKGMESDFFLVDASTGTIRWELKDFFGKSIFAEVIDGNPIETGNGSFIISTIGGKAGGGIYCFSAADGKQQWRADVPQLKGAQTTTRTETKLATSFLEKDKFIFMRGQAVMAYDIKTGKPLWAEPAKQKGLPDLVIYDPAGLIVASAVDPKNTMFKPTMVMYDYATGRELWAEPIKLKGTVKKYSYSAKGLIVGLDGGSGSSMINIVGLESGEYLFKDFYKVDGSIQEMKLISNALYVRTELEEDLISLESNKSILDKNISTKAEMPLVNLRAGDFSYTFNPSNDMLFVTDLKAGTQKPLVADKITFEQKEDPTRIEIIKDQIVISSSQTVAGFGKDGKEIFKTHIPAPGIAGWKKALYATSAILNSMDAMRYAELEAKARETSKNVKSPEAREFCDAIAQIANRGVSANMAAASREMDMMKKRYKASASGNDVQFILGKLESKDYALIGVSKITGKKIAELNFGKDKEPKYLLDDVSRVVYYLYEFKEMRAIKY